MTLLASQADISPTKTSVPIWVVWLLPALLTFLFYLPVLNNGFVLWDDPPFITENPYIRVLNFHFFQWMWSTFYTGNWYPMSWFSLALDYSLAGLHPWLYHLHSLVLHVLNTLLVYFISCKFLNFVESNQPNQVDQRKAAAKIPSAFLCSVIFGLHPIHVESAAWAAERRDVLFAFYFLGSLCFYLDFASQSQTKRWKLGVSLFLFTLSLMSKPMAVTLPLVFLLLDWYPLGRLRRPQDLSRILIEKIPFLFFSLVLGIITIFAQSNENDLYPTDTLTIGPRILNAFHSIGFYLLKLVIPSGLTPFYPLNTQWCTPSPPVLGSIMVFLLVSSVCFLTRKKFPFFLVAWLYFLVTLAPTLGLLQTGSQAAADRFTYLPSLGLILLFSTIVTKALSGKPMLWWPTVVSLSLGLGITTMGQLSVWKDSVSLWEDVVKNSPYVSQFAYANLARSYNAAGRFDDAINSFNQALLIPPDNPKMRDELGVIFLQENRVDEAIQEFKKALELSTQIPPFYFFQHLWFAYENKGMQDEALGVIKEVLKIKPDFAQGYSYLGITYWNQKDFEDSEDAFKKAFSLDPGNPEYLLELGGCYQKTGKKKEAIDSYKKGIELFPDNPQFSKKLMEIYSSKN